MLGRARNTRTSNQDETTHPLLEGNVHEDNLLFSVDDDSDSHDGNVLPTPPLEEEEYKTTNGVRSPGSRAVRFNDDVHVIGPPLRSNIYSREIEFELDSDDLEGDDTIDHLNGDASILEGRSRHPREQRVPLLVGLLESSSRRSVDSAVPTQIGDDLFLEEAGSNGVEGPSSGGNLLASIANMANSILGAGIIGLPYAISQAGFFTGLFLLVVLCAITDWTIRLIVTNAKLSGRNSYIGIMDYCFGSSGRAAVSFFQFSFAFGGMCAFGIIIGDTIPSVIRHAFPGLSDIPVLSLLTNRQFVIVLCTICISYPLSLHREIHKLSHASGLALVGMLIIVTSVMIEGPHVTDDLKGDPSQRFTFIQPSVFQAIGVISFAFVCHHNSLLIYGSMRTPTMDRFAAVTHISTAISLIACCTLAISAYVVFTNKTQGNILNNFSQSNTLINVARFCFGLNMFTTLPLELFVCREVIEQYFFSHEPFNMHRHVLFTTSIVFASMFISLITCDLGVMLEITGGISATALAFVLPAACYLNLLPAHIPILSRTKLPALICTIFGVIVLCTSLALALGKAWTTVGEPKVCT